MLLLTCLLFVVRVFDVECRCDIDIPDIDCFNATLVEIRSIPHELLFINLTVRESPLYDLPEQFVPYVDLSTVSLTKCRLIHIDRRAFRNLPLLVELDLSNNDIESLHSTTFATNGRLKTLILRSNELKYLHESLFMPTRWLTTLDISRNPFNSIDLKFMNYVRHLYMFKLDQSQLEDLNNRIDIDSNVQAVSLSDNLIKTIKETDFENFGRLVDLDLSANLIGTIHEDAFSTLNRVKRLDLSQNDLLDLPKHLFVKMVRLKELNLANNNLQTFNVDDFAHVKRLEYLNLRSNSLDTFETNEIDLVSNLISLDLSNNYFDTIPRNTFVAFKRLKRLNIEQNFLETFEEKTFATNGELQYLNMSENLIESIPSGLFSGLISLRTLDISQNEATISLPEDEFEHLVSLRSLNLTHTCLDHMTLELYSSLDRLESLKLSTNLTTMNYSDDDPLMMLKRLTFDGSQCEVYVETDGLFVLEMLESIEIIKAKVNFTHEDRVDIGLKHASFVECELVGGLPDFTFKEMRELITLKFSNTEIGSFDNSELFDELKNLEVLVLHACGLEYVDSFLFYSLESLIELDLSGNSIADLSDFSLSLTSLMTVSLRWNNISSLPDDFLDDNFIENLDVSMNYINRIDDDFFNGAFLKTLDFYGNPWRCSCLDAIHDALFQYDIDYKTFGFLDGRLPACVIDEEAECNINDDVQRTEDEINFSEMARKFIDMDDTDYLIDL